ncbi:hypothetical protein EPO33_00715 [Patescibacteria group bacterium]|nr:MAG: hypothetical protein EPO33_00715 [Patescibacteria group bacterium]
MPNELQSFVRDALLKGATREQIRDTLGKAGWNADEVKNALSAYADVTFPVPVPRRKPYLSAREAFLYLVLFLTLYISSFSFGTLLFQFINRWLPDPLVGDYVYDNSLQAIRWSTASLIIAFPVFLWLSRMLNRAIAKDPEKRGSKVRKWLTYLTLFVAAGIIIGDLITLVFNVLGGELTLRFVLKVLVVGGIAGTIFGYYLWDLRQEEKEA